jgi:hypothetical protein
MADEMSISGAQNFYKVVTGDSQIVDMMMQAVDYDVGIKDETTFLRGDERLTEEIFQMFRQRVLAIQSEATVTKTPDGILVTYNW